jgi:hypothetical protein
MKKADIDKLLEATEGIDKDIKNLIIRNVEIDWLLEETQDW